MNDPVTADQVRRLLQAYEVALDTADSLPPFVRVASRPRRWTVLEPLRRLPRPTIGTSTMVTYHVQRSTTALTGRYARIAAVRGLTDEDEQADALVRRFRESLPAIRWKVALVALVVTSLVTLRLTLILISHSVALLGFGLRLQPISDAQRDRISADISHLTSLAVFDWSSITDMLNEFGKADITELLLIAATLLATMYLVFRILSPAYRMMRMIFNLATTDNVDVRHTTMTWNTGRSIGLYQIEREVFARMDARSPTDVDLDLWVSAAAAVSVLWFLLAALAADLRGFSEDRGLDVAAAGSLASLAAARAVWLIRTARSRRRRISSVAAPAGYVAPFADRVVELRSLLETVAVAGFFAFWWFFPSPVWVRLVRERRDLLRAQQRSRGRMRRRLRGWGGLAPAIGSAILLVLLPPVPVTIHLWKLARLQRPGGSAKRTMWWATPTITAATVLFWFGFYYPPLASSVWVEVHLLPVAAAVAVVFGAIQHQQNTIIRQNGRPLPADDPGWGAEPARKSDIVPDRLPVWIHTAPVTGSPRTADGGRLSRASGG